MFSNIDKTNQEALLKKTRQLINNPTFDVNGYLEDYIATISVDGPDPEEKFFNLFEGLTNHLFDLSQIIENEITNLQTNAMTVESTLLEELDDQSSKLDKLGNVVDEVKLNFDQASEGAVRVGGLLSTSEKERLNIRKSIDLWNILSSFEQSNLQTINLTKISSQELKDLLPEQMRDQDWGTISKILHDLLKIVIDINSEEVLKAQKIVISIAEAVETELLGQFESILVDIMKDPSDEKIENARDLAEYLHLFNNGTALHKRYIYIVIEKRIPDNAVLQGKEGKNSNPWEKIRKAFQQRPNFDDDHSSSGASDSTDDVEPESMEITHGNLYSQEEGSLQLIDSLSRLFTIINNVCKEQFDIIRRVFPSYTIARITRQLVQRIFSDPAFGIQTRVDAILCPQPPLPLADYLDALLTVREKLTALYLLLLECSSDPAMIGMGSETTSLRKATNETQFLKQKAKQDEKKIRSPSIVSASDGRSESLVPIDEKDNEEKIRSDSEIREFFDEQIAQVLGSYVGDYFEKELELVRVHFVNLLRKAVDDPAIDGKVSSGTVLQLPHFKAEKMKSIHTMVKSVANKNLLNGLFSITTDATVRMESIGRDDRRLPNFIKDLFILHNGFICNGLIIPFTKASINLLLKIISNKKQSNSTLPTFDLLSIVTALCYGRARIKSHFEEIFVRPLSAVPNVIAICKENMKKTSQALLHVANQSLHAWILGIMTHLEKTLTTVQSRFDYLPKYDPLTGNLIFVGNIGSKAYLDPSPACDAVCRDILQVTNTVRKFEQDLVGIDMNKSFWKPFGQQLVALLISHIRRQKISLDGYKLLARDLEEYRNVTVMMNSVETMDMMLCLSEICSLFAVSSAEVTKVITEDLRHLDTSIILGLAKARQDFNQRGADNWSKELSATFMNYKWDVSLPWENKKPLTVLTFTETYVASSSGSNTMGPLTLRKSSAPVSALYINEVLRKKIEDKLKMNQTPGHGPISIDLSVLENGDDIEGHIRAAEASRSQIVQNTQLDQQRIHSDFLASRPDEDPNYRPASVQRPTSMAVSRPDLIDTENPRASTRRSSNRMSQNINSVNNLSSNSIINKPQSSSRGSTPSLNQPSDRNSTVSKQPPQLEKRPSTVPAPSSSRSASVDSSTTPKKKILDAFSGFFKKK